MQPDALNHTHDPKTRSWLDSANLASGDFPIQNLPFAIFRRAGGAKTGEAFRGGVAVGDQAIDLATLANTRPAALQGETLACAAPALNVGRVARPGTPITPNFQWIPIAYHGRASTIGVSGQRFHRPMGQSMAKDAKAPVYGPCARLDYELELALWIGQGNEAGEQVPLAKAESHIFGNGLLDDWSARDIQFWEMAPLGPFLVDQLSPPVLEHRADARAPYGRRLQPAA